MEPESSGSPALAGRFFSTCATWEVLELPYDGAIPLLGIELEKTLIRKDTHTPVFIAALFTIAKTWKQPKYPWMKECIKKMWPIYTMEYYSAMKKNEIMAFQQHGWT